MNKSDINSLKENIDIIHLNPDGSKADVTKTKLLARGNDWATVVLKYNVNAFGIPTRYNTVKMHLIESSTVWVGEFLTGINGRDSYRYYYNVNEPLRIRDNEITFKDLKLDIIEDSNRFSILDIEEFRDASLTDTQIKIVEMALMDVINGKIKKMCRKTGGLKPLKKL